MLKYYCVKVLECLSTALWEYRSAGNSSVGVLDWCNLSDGCALRRFHWSIEELGNTAGMQFTKLQQRPVNRGDNMLIRNCVDNIIIIIKN